ncbi:MAG: AAA family ATPase [Alphaproteobacteria bacterium]|nr:AAA family ATPase [Alphaproteobacteria bacterium]
MRTFRIFVSSPRDVGSERALAARVIDRLRFEFRGQLDIAPVFWEQMPMLATDTFQAQIPLAGEADLCVFILWSWFGTPLPQDFRRPDGRPYASGTEFEFENAVASHATKGTPDILVYRKTAELRAAIHNRDQVLERLAQRDAVQSFIEHYFRGEGGTFKAAFREFESPADFEEMLETHLRELIRAQIQGEGHQAAPLWTESPFRGLQIFDREHALIFCGRTRAVTEVLDALRRQAEAARPCVLVIGTSGSGKSSLLRAGVLPMLVQPRVVEEVAAWRTAVLRPSDDPGGPVASLAAALLADSALPELAATGTDQAALTELLRDKPAAILPSCGLILARAAEQARQSGAAAAGVARLVVVIDQLEELFATAVSQAERDAFAAALAALAHSGQIWVLATLRADFYPHCGGLPDTFSDLIRGDGTYELRPPRPAEIAQMVRRPALIAGLSFERHPESEEGLDDVLRDAAAAHPSALPLLQFALDELYKRRSGNLLRFADYEELGGLEGALRQRAEEEYGDLPEPVRAALPTVLGALVRIGLEDDAVAPRRVPRAQFAANPGALAFADAFVAARLFVADRAQTDGEAEGATIGVAHEALLREWPRARAWIEENKETLRRRARVAAAAMLWRDSGQDKARLLPPGRALSEAAALLADPAVALTPATAEFIAASQREAAHRRRRQRMRVAAAAAVALAGLSGAAAYYDAYVATKTRYYPLFSRRFGILQGLGAQLSDDEVRHREQSMQISFAGRYGLPTGYAILNGHGACVQNPSVQTFLGALQSIGKAMRECRSELTFKDGKPTGEIAYDAYGRLIYSFIYSDDSRTTATYHSGGGGAIPLALSGASAVHFTRITEGPTVGYDGAVHYMNAYGSPEPDSKGSYGMAYQYDDRGMPVALTELGPDDRPLLPKNGPATTRIAFDARGEFSRVDYLDEKGRPMKNPQNGAASVQFERDRYGNATGLTFLDERGKPVNGVEGYARVRRVFDEWGDQAENAFFDKYGDPVRAKAGFGKVTIGYDERGHWVERAYFTEDGSPVAPPDQSQIVRVRYDGFGNIAEWDYLDQAGQPVTLAAGYARVQKTYDAHSNELTETLLDKDGKPVIAADGSAGMHYAYDSNDRQISETYVDLAGKPVRIDEGYAEQTWRYDDRGNIKGESYLDENGKPVAGPNGWARTDIRVDDHGDETEQAYFDASDQPAKIDVGYSSVSYTYDGRGNQTEIVYYSDPGQLLESQKGCAKIDKAYDDYRRMVEWTCRDAHGALLMIPARGYARQTEAFDDRGNPLADAYFDAQNHPVVVSSLGYATLRVTYDDDDNPIDIMFLDADAQPIAPPKWKCAHFALSYVKGKQVSRRCLDPSPDPGAGKG